MKIEHHVFTEEQEQELIKELDPRLIKNRKGGSNRTLSYLEGHTAIDQANRLLGLGNWGYRTLSCEMVILPDPLTGEAVGIEYKAIVEVTIRGGIAPLVDVGSQPVAAWNVADQVFSRRIRDANKHNKSADLESPPTPFEAREARAVIAESHEQAKKASVTDGLKRALRALGPQFGNSLYGDGMVDLTPEEPKQTPSGESVQVKDVRPGVKPAAKQPVPAQRVVPQSKIGKCLPAQRTAIINLSKALGLTPPTEAAIQAMSESEAGNLISALNDQASKRKQSA
jgi:hypothetical protein